MSCVCCERDVPIVCLDLCRRCYTNVVQRNKHKFPIDYIGKVYKIHDKVCKEPLTREDVSVLFESRDNGSFHTLPLAFWDSPYLDSNVSLCLEYLFIKIHNISKDDINEVHHRRLIYHSYLCTLLSKGMPYIRKILSEIYGVEVI